MCIRDRRDDQPLQLEHFRGEKQSVDAVNQERGFDRQRYICLLYTSDAADERSSVDLGGRRIIKKKHNGQLVGRDSLTTRKVTEHNETQSTDRADDVRARVRSG